MGQTKVEMTVEPKDEAIQGKIDVKEGESEEGRFQEEEHALPEKGSPIEIKLSANQHEELYGEVAPSWL